MIPWTFTHSLLPHLCLGESFWRDNELCCGICGKRLAYFHYFGERQEVYVAYAYKNFEKQILASVPPHTKTPPKDEPVVIDWDALPGGEDDILLLSDDWEEVEEFDEL